MSGSLRASWRWRPASCGARARTFVRAGDHRAEGAAGAHPRRLHLDPRGHHRRRHHRTRRKNRRILLGPAARQRHRRWLAYVIALVFLLSGRTACSASASSSASETSHVLPRSRPYKTNYRADQALFPIRQNRRHCLILAAAFILTPLTASDFVIDSIPPPDLGLRGRAELGHGTLAMVILWSLVIGHWSLVIGHWSSKRHRPSHSSLPVLPSFGTVNGGLVRVEGRYEIH